MFAWISKRLSTPWSRRTRWTPLLENQREFQRTLAKERSRVDREGGYFGFVILRFTELHNVRGQSVHLAKILHRRLRTTDEKGHLGYGRLGLMLPMTPQLGCDLVLVDVLRIARLAGIEIEGEALVYPERSDRGHTVDDQLHQGHRVETEDESETANAGGSFAQMASLRTASKSSTLAMMLPKYPTWKRFLDIAGASLGLVIAAPFLLICGLLIKLTSRGPILYRQERTGYLGQTFTIYKLRSMVDNADALKAALRESNERDGPAFKMRGDPRITLVGKLLRSTGLDELPQLVNVLRGDMSLVGPRPLPVEEAAQCAGWQRRREEVKPGLTCFWQLAKSRQIPFVDWMRLDLHYAQNASPSLDVRLIAKTFISVFLGRVGH